MTRIVVAMSGGVDSSVTAALLKQQGHEVIGVTLNVWPERDAMQALVEREDACCSLGAVEDARRVAAQLHIPYYVLNFKDVFRRHVMANFAAEYARGRTPNPCARCNDCSAGSSGWGRSGCCSATGCTTRSTPSTPTRV